MDSYLSPFIFGVVGHRDALLEDIRLKEKVIGIFQDFFEKYPHTPIILMSALAEGADRFVAKLALEFNSDKKNNPAANKIQLYVPLPMPLAEYRKDFQSEESLQEFDTLMKQSIESYEISTSEDLIFKDLSLQENRDKQYRELAVYLAKHSRILIALWDGVDNNKVGGTSEVIKFKRLGLPDDAQKSNPLEIVEFGLVYHIKTPRESNRDIIDPYGKEILYPLDFNHVNWNKKYSQEILTKTDAFNKDILQNKNSLNQEILNSQADLLKLPRPVDEKSKSKLNNKISELSKEEKNILEKFSISDSLAIKFKQKKFSINKLFFLGILISLAFYELYAHHFAHCETKSIYGLITYVIFIILLLSINIIYYKIIKPQRTDVKHQEYRAIAEAYRVQFYWHYIDIDENASDYFLVIQKDELYWIKEVIKSSNFIPRFIKDKLSINDKLETNRAEFVREAFVEDQLKFFKKNVAKKYNSLKKLTTVAKYMYLISLLLALSQFILIISDNIFYQSFFLISIILLIACSASIELYLDRIGIDQEINLYKKAIPFFNRGNEALKAQINDLHEENNSKAINNIIIKLGKELLRENGIWLFINKDATPPK